jgi:hypothetical protein
MNRFRPILSVMLASLVLIASIGVTVNLHLCGGQIQSIAVFTKAQPCMKEAKPCHESKHASRMKGCCEEKSIVFKGKDTTAEVRTATEVVPSFNLFAVVLPVLYSILPTDRAAVTFGYAQYKPPLPPQDITVLVHSFLI